MPTTEKAPTPPNTLYVPEALPRRIRKGRERSAWKAYGKAVEAARAAGDTAKAAAEATRAAEDAMFAAREIWRAAHDEMRMRGEDQP